MTEAERNAINARKKELIANGVSKEMADIIAKVFFESGLLSPVLDGNYSFECTKEWLQQTRKGKYGRQA